MWRKCDLHVHTSEDRSGSPQTPPKQIVKRAIDAGIELIAITDHDSIDHVDGVVDAAADESSLQVMRGVELSTRLGHVLIYDPAGSDCELLKHFLLRVGASPTHRPDFHEAMTVLRKESSPTGTRYADRLVAIGAHVNAAKSLLATNQPGTHLDHIDNARSLDALEVNDAEGYNEWTNGGIKSTGRSMALVQFSDAHIPEDVGVRSTWIYLPELSRSAMLQAFGTSRASVAVQDDRPTSARTHIEALSIVGGMHDGLSIPFSPRINAIIGPPSVGKSLIVDALRFVFDEISDIDEVRMLSQHRMDRTLPQGSVVKVTLRINNETLELHRTVGASTVPECESPPILFSQTELTRRAMESQPAIDLIDIHADGLSEAHARYDEQVTEVGQLVADLILTSQEIAELSPALDNEVDGLAATQDKIKSLGGNEKAANRAEIIAAVLDWRSEVRKAIRDFVSSNVSTPEIEDVPELSNTESDLSESMPRLKILAELRNYSSQVKVARETLGKGIDALLGDDALLVDENDELEVEISEAGQEDAEHLLDELESLRRHNTALGRKNRKRNKSLSKVDALFANLRDALGHLESASQSVTDARKDACRKMNPRLGSFFCKIDSGANTTAIAAIRELRTNARANTIAQFTDGLDSDFCLAWIGDTIKRVCDHDVTVAHSMQLPPLTDRIYDSMVESNDYSILSKVVTTRSDDVLTVGYRNPTNGKPTYFTDMTEGLRALAIKELSFASSDRIVITDQPEDSVPTRAVYDELAERLKEQRGERQFIVVSHDANIVVGSDADRVIVLTGDDQRSVVGTLFDSDICRHAMNHLEGGPEAFELRSERYSALSADS